MKIIKLSADSFEITRRGYYKYGIQIHYYLRINYISVIGYI